MTPERAKALENIAEAARRVIKIGLVQSDGALAQYIAALDALPAEPADAGEMVEVQKPKVIAFSEGDDWRTVLFDDGSMFTAMDGGRTWKPIDLPHPVMPVVRAEVET